MILSMKLKEAIESRWLNSSNNSFFFNGFATYNMTVQQ